MYANLQHGILRALILIIVVVLFTSYYECLSISKTQCPVKYVSCTCRNMAKHPRNNVTIAVQQCHTNLSTVRCVPCDLIPDDKRCSIYNLPSAACHNCTTSTLCPDCRTNYNICNNGTAQQSRNKRQVEEKVECPKPTDPNNGKAEFEAAVFKVGDAVKYHCNEGFTMLGSATRHCNANGRWSGERPTCEKQCSFPTMKKGIKYIENPGRKDNLQDTRGNTVLFEIEFQCEGGYDLIGAVRIRCQSGKWDQDVPECAKSSATQCLNPGVIENGEQDPSPTTMHFTGSTIAFKCNSGYRLVGSSLIICTDSGSWSAKLPSCVSTGATTTSAASTMPSPSQKTDSPVSCQKPHDLHHGLFTFTIASTVNISSTTNIFEVGTSVQYTCNHPYELHGPTEQYCIEAGYWSGQRPKCIPACGKGVEPKSPQVVGGTTAKQNGYPWQVALTTYISRAEIRYIHCGGVVLSEKWVLTAAHCITVKGSKDLLDPSTFLLLFGKHYTNRNIDNNDVISRKISQTIMHPAYNPWTFDNDLGLMLLDTELVFNDVVLPLCLPSSSSLTTFTDGLKGVVTGWGNIDKEGTAPVELMVIELPIVNNEKCEESYRSHNFKTTVTDNMFCAGEDEGGKNTCQGDSGGSMAFYNGDHFILEGIVSWGNKDDCAAAGFYGGFVRVRNFVHWIQKYVPV